MDKSPRALVNSGNVTPLKSARIMASTQNLHSNRDRSPLTSSRQRNFEEDISAVKKRKKEIEEQKE